MTREDFIKLAVKNNWDAEKDAVILDIMFKLSQLEGGEDIVEQLGECAADDPYDRIKVLSAAYNLVEDAKTLTMAEIKALMDEIKSTNEQGDMDRIDFDDAVFKSAIDYVEPGEEEAHAFSEEEIGEKFKQISELINGTLTTKAQVEKYSSFIMTMKEIDAAVRPLYGTDNTVSADDLKKLIEVYEKGLEACENILEEGKYKKKRVKNEDEDEDEYEDEDDDEDLDEKAREKKERDDAVTAAMKGIAAQMQSLLSLDKAAFESVDLSDKLTMDQILTLGRTLTVDIGDQKVATVGNAMSSRIPMKLVRGKKEVEGFFTKSSYTDTDKQLTKVYNRLEKKYPTLKGLIDIMRGASVAHLYNMSSYSQNLNTAMEEMAKEHHVNPDKLDEKTIDRYAREYYAETFSKEFGDMRQYQKNPDFVRLMAEFSEKTGQIIVTNELYVHNNTKWLGVPQNSTIDKRNVAMSAVAKFFGKSDLVAEAQPLIVTMDGVAVSGTFMKKADGYSAYDLSDDNPMIHYEKKVYDNPKVFGDIAAMQALDYICGNIDRHIGNFFCDFEEVNGEVKLKKITCIDNDMSFGMNIDNKDSGNMFVQPKDMGAIGKDIADKILLMDQATLANMLRGFGLSQEEIDAAWTRTVNLQEAIKEGLTYYKENKIEEGKLEHGHLRVIAEKDWEKYSLKSLANGSNQFNAISDMADNFTKKLDELREKEKNFKETKENIKKYNKIIFKEDRDMVPEEGPEPGQVRAVYTGPAIENKEAIEEDKKERESLRAPQEDIIIDNIDVKSENIIIDNNKNNKIEEEPKNNIGEKKEKKIKEKIIGIPENGFDEDEDEEDEDNEDKKRDSLIILDDSLDNDNKPARQIDPSAQEIKDLQNRLKTALSRTRNYADAENAVRNLLADVKGHTNVVHFACVALAIKQQRERKKPFSRKEIGKRAAEIKKEYFANPEIIERYTDRQILKTLEDRNKLHEMDQRLFKNVYGIKGVNETRRYIADMESLRFNMMNSQKPDERSEAYQGLVRAIGDASMLDPSANRAEQLRETAKANHKVITAAKKYMSDKMSVRS